MLSKTGKLRSGYEEITPPHLALMKVEIQAEGCFFFAALTFLVFCVKTKEQNKIPKLQTSGNIL